MELISKFTKKSKYVRIILFHEPYTESQQHIIDSVMRQSTQIIGQVLRKTDVDDNNNSEIMKLIDANSEPRSVKEKISYVVLGKQTRKHL